MTLNKNRNVRRLGVESCENRIALAGDVGVALEGSLLNVIGDNLDNQIAIQQSLSGNVTVTGLNGTTVNGLPSFTLIRPALETLDVRMGDGNDRVTIGRVGLAGDLNVELGLGDDFVSTSAQVGGNVSLLGDQGIDQANVTNATVAGDLLVDLGTDSGRIVLTNANIGFTATLLTDDANDVITVRNSTVGGALSVESKKGDDTVNIFDSNAFQAAINTDAGADRVTVTNFVTTEDFVVETGENADRVNLTNLLSGKSISVNTDSGNDFVAVTSVSAAVDAIFAGGAGTDTFDNNGFSAGSIREIKEFELLI